MKNDIGDDVRNYYANKIKLFGATPKGVDWNGEESQITRFDQLVKIISSDRDNFSTLDYGCGYGALLKYLRNQFGNVNYTGFDICEEMVQQAKAQYDSDKAEWLTEKKALQTYDYVIASGIFNVKQNIGDADWLKYVKDTLVHMNEIAQTGFAFNILTSYSDPKLRKDYLYYGDPLSLFSFCKENLSPSVALLHDYKLYEFTMLIRKE